MKEECRFYVYAFDQYVRVGQTTPAKTLTTIFILEEEHTVNKKKSYDIKLGCTKLTEMKKKILELAVKLGDPERLPISFTFPLKPLPPMIQAEQIRSNITVSWSPRLLEDEERKQLLSLKIDEK